VSGLKFGLAHPTNDNAIALFDMAKRKTTAKITTNPFFIVLPPYYLIENNFFFLLSTYYSSNTVPTHQKTYKKSITNKINSLAIYVQSVNICKTR